MMIEGSTHHILPASASQASKKRKGNAGECDAGIGEAGLKDPDDAFITPPARPSKAAAVGSGVTSGSNESANVSRPT